MQWIRAKQSCQTWTANVQNSGHSCNSFTCIYYSPHAGCMWTHMHTVCTHANLAVLPLLEFHILLTCKKYKCESICLEASVEKGWICCNILVPNRIGSVDCRVITEQKSSPSFPLGQQGLWKLVRELPVPGSGSATNWCSLSEPALVLKATLLPLKASDRF